MESQSYKIEIPKKTLKKVESFSQDTKDRIKKAFEEIQINPKQNQRTIKMTGFEIRYRYRIGDFRIVYDIFESNLIILILDIDKRSDVYKKR